MPKYLALLMFIMTANVVHADLIDFHFGGLNQTGPAVLGSTGDIWNSTNEDNGGASLLLNNQGQATPISASWTSGNAWAATTTIYTNMTSSGMDQSTSWLMRSFAASYQYYSSEPSNLTVTLHGLVPTQVYTLVLLSAGDQKNEGTLFTITGSGTFNGSTSGLNRKLTSGPGVAYCEIQVTSSAQGTLKITAQANGYHYAVLNGFQLGLPTTTTTSSSTSSTTATSGSIAWGVCGHPTWSDYSNYIPANTITQIGYLQQLGCKYYRCSFEGAEYPQILDEIVPKFQAAGVNVLPILPVTFKASESTAVNYSTNYTIACNWAKYAISQGYSVPYWELGNEVENWGLVSVTYDGASPNDFPDEVPGGFAAIASGLSGAYQGLKDTYAIALANGQTSIKPQVLFGCCYRHWGLLQKIQTYNGSLPCDIISWHWYGPSYGVFNQPIDDPHSVSNGRTPAQCLGDFMSHTTANVPMDIWITETDRAQVVNGQLQNGSVSSNANPAALQDWTAQASAIEANITSFKAVSTVKGIFVYELFDETRANDGSTAELASEGYMGLVTRLNGTRKNAFFTFESEIEQGP